MTGASISAAAWFDLHRLVPAPDVLGFESQSARPRTDPAASPVQAPTAFDQRGEEDGYGGEWVGVARRFRSQLGSGFEDVPDRDGERFDRAVPGWLTLSRPVPRGLLLGIGLVLLFALALYRDIAFSLVRSRLAVPPGYDDVVYLLDAMQRWRFELPHGLGALVSGLISHPPHAPVSTLTGIAGFALFGPEILSAYLANGWILAIYVAAMAVISRPLGGVVPRLLFVAALLFARVSQAMITEFRPDMAAGLVFALALVAITATDLLSASPLRRAGVAALAALATVIKPTGAVLVMPGIGVAILATLVLQARAGRGSWLALLRALLLPSAVYLLLLTPFAIAWGRETYEYILQTLVTNADIWRTEGGLLIHWTYHLFGYGATKALMPFNILGLIAIVADLRALRRAGPSRQRTSAYALYVTIAVLYVAMAMTAEKTPFQGSYFYLPFLFAAALAAARVLAAVQPAWHVSAGLAALVLVLAVVRPYGSSYSSLPPAAADLPQLYSNLSDRVAAIVAGGGRGAACPAPPMLLATDPTPITPDAVSFDLARRGLRMEVGQGYMSRSEDAVDALLASAGMVVVPDRGLSTANDWLPGTRFAEPLRARLAGDGAWSGEIVGTAAGLPVWLFVRKACLPPPPP